MERRSVLSRRGGLVATAVVVAMVLAGCGRNSPVGTAAVATVNGRDISPALVRRIVDAQVAYGEATKKSGKVDPAQIDKRLAEFRGTGVDTMSTAGAASVISSILEREITADALRKAGGEVTAADRASARTQITQQLKQQSVSSTKSFQGLVDFEVDRAATRAALTKAFERTEKPAQREADLRAAFEAQKASLPEELCVAVIATPDQASADQAASRVKGGEDFAKVALQVSTQPPTGDPTKDVPCVARNQVAGLFPDAASAKAGAVLGPAQSQGQDPTQQVWLVVKIDRIQKPAFASVRSQLDQSVPRRGAQAAAKALAKAFGAAKVTVDPRYGTWKPKRGVVEPPLVPGATTTTTIPSAASGG
ncbi:MAG: hypothetical protein ACR2MB_08220 [Acidimicrobiales bacterium]